MPLRETESPSWPAAVATGNSLLGPAVGGDLGGHGEAFLEAAAGGCSTAGRSSTAGSETFRRCSTVGDG